MFYLSNTDWREVATNVGEVYLTAVGCVRVAFSSTTPGPTDGRNYSFRSWGEAHRLSGGGLSMWIKSHDIGQAGINGMRSACWVRGDGFFTTADTLPGRTFNSSVTTPSNPSNPSDPVDPIDQIVTASILGYNANGFTDFHPGHVFLNLAKQLRPWFNDVDGQNVRRPDFQDDNHYYTAIPTGATEVRSVWAWTNLADTVQRQYKLTFTGVGTLVVGGSETVVNSQTANEVIFTLTGNGNVTFVISDIPNPSNYPRDFVIVPTGTDWETRLANGEIFTPEFLDHLMPNGLPLAEYRHLNTMEVNSSTVVDWAEYPTVSSATYTHYGVPVELIGQMALQGNHTPWVCIPAMASDDFVVQMARALQAVIPTFLNKIKVEYTNETWNTQFMQFAWCLYNGLKEWGNDLGTVVWNNANKTITVTNATGISVGDPYAIHDPGSRRTIQGQITQINGTTLTVNQGNLPSGSYSGVTGTGYWHNEWHAKRSSEVMAVWENAVGVRPVRVMAGQGSNTNVINSRLDPTVWRDSGDPAFVEPSSVHDAIAMGAYFQSDRTQGRVNVRAQLAISEQAMRDWALDQILNQPGIGMDFLRTNFVEHRAVADTYDLKLVIYEGMSDHTISGLNGNNAEDTAFWQAYNRLVYSEDFNPCWAAHIALVKEFIDGPEMIYRELGTAGPAGLWHLFEQMGVPNPRSIETLRLAALENPWWGPNFAPQAVNLPARIERTTFDVSMIDMSSWFTPNAAVITATGLPSGFTIAGKNILVDRELTPGADTVVDVVFTAATSANVSDDFTVTFDLTYEPAPTLPTPLFVQPFDNADSLTLRRGAVVTNGVLDVSSTNRPQAVLNGLSAAVEANPPTTVTMSLVYNIANGEDMTGLSFVGGMATIEDDRLRLRRANGGFLDFTGLVITQADGLDHRITLVLDTSNNSAELYVDGTLIQSASQSDFGAGDGLASLNTQFLNTFILGANQLTPPSINLVFKVLSVWNVRLTPEQINTLGSTEL